MPQSQDNPLDILKVIDTLEVGPLRLEKRRFSAPYRVSRAGGGETLELVYRYEEDVFDPDEPASQNLAGMVAAQVAINYGLFCDRIIFRDRFDRLDRRFIEDMARNTAREIYVKKFLEPNPFLSGPAAQLPPVRRRNYLAARLVFEGERPAPRPGPSGNPDLRSGWHPDRSRHAILSSGGKDSLLTYGLLTESGCQTHPLFVNESGRHWFTALNAFREFAARVPNTARVWTNSDRVFSGMLKHLPFVRRDHASVRSDEYPIRLWTVAVFLFGVLPLVRKRGIGRLLVGDEYDTTNRTSLHGITHYDGLFDQSRYFDHALTRYFQSKGWGVSQFSVLRPLSELLIEKILVERYPDLQRLQTSCHATHKEEDGIRPCGRCEKCRRIVGMLLALDADPGHCGYKPDQVQDCLRQLQRRGVHQEERGAEQLAFLLRQKNLLPEPLLGPVKARQRPEIMSLRFDPERSPIEEIPPDLRQPLFRICLEHARGAVSRQGRVWIDLDLLTDPRMKNPYPFEHPAGGEAPAEKTGKAGDPAPAGYLLAELTWPEARERLRVVDVALLPVGAIEQHGLHLPLDTDAFDADYLARQVAEACGEPRPLVLPLVPYGVSYHHEDFSGTLSLSPETLSRLIYDIGMSAARHGVTKLVIINGHGGNGPALHYAAQMINRDALIFTCVDTGESSDPDVYALSETPNDVHAGEIETSTTLAVRPGAVRREAARKFVPQFSSRYLDFTSKRSVGWYARTAKISPSGVLGDPTRATAEKGRRMWEFMIRNLVEFVEDLKRLSLDEIFQKRY